MKSLATTIPALADAAEEAAVPGYGDAIFWFALIDENEAAKFQNETPRTLQKQRQTGSGPKFVRLSARAIRYRRWDLNVYNEARLRASTSDPGPEADAA